MMKIYIDFDDVICETAKYFTKIAKEMLDMDGRPSIRIVHTI